MSEDSLPRGGRTRPLGLVLAVGAVVVLVLVAVGRLPVVRGEAADVTAGRPPAVTTPVPPRDAEDAEPEPLPRTLLASSGGDHRWFLGLRGRDIGGYAIGHQGPEMPSDAFRVVSGFGGTPRMLVAFGPRAWVITPPPAPGGESPVFGLRLARNEIHDVWYPLGRTTLTPVPRLPAGVLPLVAGASPDGPVLVAAPRATGGPRRLLRLAVEQWIEHPLADPFGVDPETLAAEIPLALAVVRLPGDAVADGADGADAAGAEAADAPADDAEPAPEPAGDAAAAAEGVRVVETVALTMLLVAGPEGLAIDLVGASGERARAWTGEPEVAAAILRATDPSSDGPEAASAGPGFHATLVDVERQPWLAVRRGTEVILEPLAYEPSAAGPGRLRLGGPGAPRIEAEAGDELLGVIGGDGLMLVEGDGFDDADAPTRVRAWTAGGTVDLEGPLTAVEVDPSVILRGPIIIGTGIFFAVIIGVLSSRPGARPPAIEGREATVGRRLTAAWIDALAPLVAAGLVFGWTPEALIASLLLLHPAGFAPWLGFALLWSFATVVGDMAGGRTPGRLVMRVRPVDAEGRRPGRGRLLLRFVIRTLSVGFPPLVMFWLAHARNRGLHDLAAGTWVVRTDRRAAAPGDPTRE